MECYVIYQCVYLILNELIDEKSQDNKIQFLSDANPYIWEGETSGDLIVYDDFKSKYNEWNKHDDYSYEFVCNYLKNLDPYYGDIYSIFMQLSKEEYVDTCKNILENFPEQIKKV